MQGTQPASAVSRPLRRKSPGMGLATPSSSTVGNEDLLARELSASPSSSGVRIDPRNMGEVVSTPGVTGGVGLGVPPANAWAGGVGLGSAKIR